MDLRHCRAEQNYSSWLRFGEPPPRTSIDVTPFAAVAEGFQRPAAALAALHRLPPLICAAFRRWR
jgi:hypothetical protein